MNTYSAYKDSGEQWLGQIPEHWEIRKLKYVLQLRKKIVGADAKKYDLLSLTLKGVIKRDIENPTGKFPTTFDSYQEVNENDFIFCNFDNEETPRAVGLSPYRGMITGAYDVLRRIDEHCNDRFLFYYFLWIDDAKRFKPLYKGLRKTIPLDSFLSYKLALPPKEEQEAMVAYLDEQTGKLDQAIAREQKMIDLLEERKQIIIQHAVTKGLNPNAPMKDSGIEWIGEIPAHWKLMQYRHLFYNLDNLRQPITADQRSRNNPKYDYYGASGVIDKIDYYNVDDKVLLIGEDGANLLMRNLPLIYKAEGKFWVNNHAHILKPIRDDYDFMAYVMESADYTIYITGSAQPKLSQSNLNMVKLPIPPNEEQKDIVAYINNAIIPIDRAIESREKLISLLRERKQIIINEVVTGKIKVGSAFRYGQSACT